jgi:hypothetical protein
MNMKLAFTLLLALASGGLSAQASAPISGWVTGFDQLALLVSVDFGPTPQSVQLEVNAQQTQTSTGTLLTTLFDLTELADNGSTQGVFGPIQTPALWVQTPSYSGIVDFMIGFTCEQGFGMVGYSGVVSCATLTAGSITIGPSQLVPLPNFSNEIVHGRMVQGSRNATAPIVYEFSVNYGLSPHSIRYWLQGGGTAGGTITVSELDSSGNPVTSLSVTDTSSFKSEINGNTSTRVGKVRFRVTATPASNGTFDWTVCFPGSVSIEALEAGGGGGGGGDEGGCSTGRSRGLELLALLGVLAACAALRLRR